MQAAITAGPESIYGKAYQASETPHFHTSIYRYIIVHSNISLDSSLGRRPKSKSDEFLLWTILCTRNEATSHLRSQNQVIRFTVN